MEISKKLKIALDDTRMGVLGVQILIGFSSECFSELI
jgi:hypothetical protein